MTRTISECIGCTHEGLPCLGAACTMREVTHRVCDCCGDEIGGEYFAYNGHEYCGYCIMDVLDADGVIERCEV